MKKEKNWTEDIKKLAIIAEEETQSAFSAFNTAILHGWTFLQRTVEGISAYFQPLEDAIREKLIPALIGKHVSDVERQIISLPYRLGGLGIQNPVETADQEYATSQEITQDLTQLIIAQDMDITKFDADKSMETKMRLKAAKEISLKQKAEDLKQVMTESSRTYFEGAQEKGASSWLSALPLKKLGYSLNKQEFRDAVSLRYGWEIRGTPKACVCGEKNTLDHSLICKRGGFVAMRHNILRNVEANLMKEVCRDVQIEPTLLPTNAEELRQQTNNAPGARLDVSARGVWSEGEKTFFDIRVRRRHAESNREKSFIIGTDLSRK